MLSIRDSVTGPGQEETNGMRPFILWTGQIQKLVEVINISSAL